MDYDVIILGGGPAGITSAIYCARSNLKVALLDTGLIGGNPLNYLEIDNYPGLPGTTENLIDCFINHLDKYPNIERFEFVDIEYIDLANTLVKTADNELKARFIIIATGSKPRMLHVPGEIEFLGKGVHYCAICDGPLYTGKIVTVIGGGNSACEEALGLSKICEHVHIIEFSDKLNAEKSTIDKIYNTPNIGVSLNTRVDEIIGDDKVTNILCTNTKDSSKTYDFTTDGVFIYVGMTPNLPNFKEIPLERFLDDYGYIYVNEDMKTSVSNVYAIGDIRSKKYRQVITAMSDGAIAAINISKS